LDYSSHPSGHFTCRFPSPHFNAFIDLDGDCLADLFFVCLGGGSRRNDPERLEYQVWTNTKGGGDGKGGKFVFKREGKLPRGTKSVTFGDMGAFSSQSPFSLFSLTLSAGGHLSLGREPVSLCAVAEFRVEFSRPGPRTTKKADHTASAMIYLQTATARSTSS
jgi:hypothetical protein